MNILAIISGDYGLRHVQNILQNAPAGWAVSTWHAPAFLPLIVEYPEDFLPASLPGADLILSFAENSGTAQLIPDLAKLVGAQAVIAGIDNEAWLPRGLARQLIGWLKDMDIACVTPKPLCTLTETHYSLGRGQRVTYQHPLISEFARYFGRPEFEIQVDPGTRAITGVTVRRDTLCGCARYVAAGLVGVSADEAGNVSGMRHHHFPCLASMGVDAAYGDTLMHVSGNILKDEVDDQVKAYKTTRYMTPGRLSE